MIGEQVKQKKGPRKNGTLSLNIFCSNNRLPADPNTRTEVIKPIIKRVVTYKFHFTFNLIAKIYILFLIELTKA